MSFDPLASFKWNTIIDGASSILKGINDGIVDTVDGWTRGGATSALQTMGTYVGGEGIAAVTAAATLFGATVAVWNNRASIFTKKNAKIAAGVLGIAAAAVLPYSIFTNYTAIQTAASPLFEAAKLWASANTGTIATVAGTAIASSAAAYKGCKKTALGLAILGAGLITGISTDYLNAGLVKQATNGIFSGVGTAASFVGQNATTIARVAGAALAAVASAGGALTAGYFDKKKTAIGILAAGAAAMAACAGLINGESLGALLSNFPEQATIDAGLKLAGDNAKIIAGAGLATVAALGGAYKLRASIFTRKAAKIAGIALAAIAGVGGLYYGVTNPAVQTAVSAGIAAVNQWAVTNQTTAILGGAGVGLLSAASLAAYKGYRTTVKVLALLGLSAAAIATGIHTDYLNAGLVQTTSGAISSKLDSIGNWFSTNSTAIAGGVGLTAIAGVGYKFKNSIFTRKGLKVLGGVALAAALIARSNCDPTAVYTGSSIPAADTSALYRMVGLAVLLPIALVAGLKGLAKYKDKLNSKPVPVPSSPPFLPSNETLISRCRLEENGKWKEGNVTTDSRKGSHHIRIRNDQNQVLAEAVVKVDKRTKQVSLESAKVRNIQGKKYSYCEQILIQAIRQKFPKITGSQLVTDLSAAQKPEAVELLTA